MTAAGDEHETGGDARETPGDGPKTPGDASADQRRCTEHVVDVTPDAAIVANLGTAAYTLIDVADRDRNFYLTGAMGVTTPIGLGLATAVDAPVTVLDGDGSMLMSLGALATVSELDSANLTIVVWNNGAFETTGGQRTLSHTTDVAAVARDCGLAAWSADTNDGFREAYAAAVDHEGASLVDCAVAPYSPDTHPPLDYAHSFLKHRFRSAMLDE